jgi:hypothetical protein
VQLPDQNVQLNDNLEELADLVDAGGPVNLNELPDQPVGENDNNVNQAMA